MNHGLSTYIPVPFFQIYRESIFSGRPGWSHWWTMQAVQEEVGYNAQPQKSTTVLVRCFSILNIDILICFQFT